MALGTILTLAVLAVAVVFYPTPEFSPVPFTSLPNYTISIRENSDLLKSEVLAKGLVGAEDYAWDSEGRMYTGLLNGTILRSRKGDPKSFEIFSHTNGRPLALRFDADGNLIIADATLGMISLDKEGHITVLTNHVVHNGVLSKFLFADHFDISKKDGKIYFSEASSKWDIHSLNSEMLEGRPYGKVLSYDPKTKKTELLADNLYFANGILLSENEDFLYFCETLSAKISKLWLSGPNKGKIEPFLEALPGYPDNISRSPRGTIWVGMPAVRNLSLESYLNHTLLRKALYHMPKAVTNPPKAGLIGEFTTEGKLVRNFNDPKGEVVHHVATATERDGYVYLGTYLGDFIARYKL
eukprot:TRINITY_DN3611_c0_g1_i1.p1 TRINITY_DN3611_c0_g1~~TRINITY_DN3611_c0_g1_i1.p1  ORF type:complete len:354 (-),score=65.34 TRINITY_DN3611_c0_g1_i1:37-1098(-)